MDTFDKIVYSVMGAIGLAFATFIAGLCLSAHLRGMAELECARQLGLMGTHSSLEVRAVCYRSL